MDETNSVDPPDLRTEPGATPLPHRAIDRAAQTLQRAFASDPLFTWAFPDPAARQRLFRVLLAYGVRYGRAMTSHDHRAVGVWIPPGPGITIPRMVRSGMLGVPFRTGFGPFGTFLAANDVMEKAHKAHAPDPHWYLMVLAVDPELQGQGVGSALVREGLAHADREARPCYLETSQPRNLAFYQRLGFAVLEEVTLGKDGPKSWAMRREPDAVAAPG